MRSIAILLAAAGLAACGARIDGPSERAATIEIVLIGGDSVETGYIRWQVPADSPIDNRTRIVDSTLVQLSLVLPGGGTVPFTPIREFGRFQGRYKAAAVAAYGATYQLHGTVDGHVVLATTTVPDSFHVFEPAQDTVRMSYGLCAYACPVPYHWRAAGAERFQYVAAKNGGFMGWGWTRDTVGTMGVVSSARPDTLDLLLFAIEAQTAAFLLSELPDGNITGVFGVFGAASRAQRVLVFE